MQLVLETYITVALSVIKSNLLRIPMSPSLSGRFQSFNTNCLKLDAVIR